jgi:hypothetical protein
MSPIRLSSTFWAKQVLNMTITRNIPEVLFTVLATLEKKKRVALFGKKEAMEDSARRVTASKRLHVNQ